MDQPARRTATSILAALGLLLLFVCSLWIGMLLHHGHSASGEQPRGPELWLTFPDVGHGDCMLVQDPSTDRVVLIDAGPDDHAAEQVLASMTKANVAHLDGIILTSDRQGSIGGLSSLLTQTRVIGPVLVPGDPTERAAHGTSNERDALSSLQSQHLRVDSIERTLAHMPEFFGANSEIHITLLPVPAAGSGKPSSGASGTTYAVRIDYGDTSVLDTASLTPAEEDRLLAGDRSNLDCDVLAIADGGSSDAASSEFLAASSPRVAAITCSVDRPPADDTLARLQAAGADIGQTNLLSNFTLRLSSYPEQPILWTTTKSQVAQQSH